MFAKRLRFQIRGSTKNESQRVLIRSLFLALFEECEEGRLDSREKRRIVSGWVPENRATARRK